MRTLTLMLTTAFMLTTMVACGGGDAGMGSSPAKESAPQQLSVK